MQEILNGLFNFLNFIEMNWGMILAICLLAASIYKRIKEFVGKSNEEKLAIAKVQISETMLKWVSMAERDWMEWSKAGEIKRSQVIDMIFDKYPILSKVTNQEEIMEWLDNAIDDALDVMRDIFEENKAKGNESAETVTVEE